MSKKNLKINSRVLFLTYSNVKYYLHVLQKKVRFDFQSLEKITHTIIE